MSSPLMIFSLPSELLEFILVLCALYESPESIAAVAQTCRFFHALIYSTADSHLWRRIYLATFDDPRPIAEIRSRPLNIDAEQQTYDWQGEFIQRSLAKRFIKKYVAITCASDDSEETSQTSDSLLSIFKSIDSVFQTAAPLLKHPEMHDPNPKLPTFAPLVLTLLSPTAEYRFSTLRSKNATWLARLLQNGFPRILTRLLIGTDVPISPANKSMRRTKLPKVKKIELEGGDRVFAPILENGWDATEEGQTFYKLVFMAGFIPSVSLSENSPRKYNLRSSGLGFTGWSFNTQTQMARGVARSKVYNISYLTSERCWGPFRPMVASNEANPPDVEEEEDNEQPSEELVLTQHRVLEFEALLNGVLLNAYGELNSDDDDADYEPPPSASGSNNHQSDEEYDDDDDDELPYFPAANLLYLAANDDDDAAHPTYIFPQYPHQVVPDYSFLASARLIIEENLRSRLRDVSDEWAVTVSVAENDAQTVQRQIADENPTQRLMDALRSLENLRMGAAPGLWSQTKWRKEDLENEELPEASVDDNEFKPKNQKEGYWDWAGVQGQWRRCVCWMDYRDLLFHNLRLFRDGGSDIRETLRIFPMHLRVVAYEDPPPPPPVTPSDSSKGKGKAREMDAQFGDPATSLVYKLPIIHIEGEARGSDMDEMVIRRIQGTVRMIGDGAVRWSLTSSEPDGSDPEWVTECVQIGSIGSAIGFIGLWTGAGHARSDPIGPTWAWRVA